MMTYSLFPGGEGEEETEIAGLHSEPNTIDGEDEHTVRGHER